MDRLNEFAEASSVHGIKYILSQDRFKSTRIFWTIAIFFSACGLGYYVYNGYHKFVYDPETVMKARERPSTDFPAPAITICSNLFATNELANIFELYRTMGINLTLTESNCTYMAANLHWCQPTFAGLIARLCPKYNLDKLNVLKHINESALPIKYFFFKCSEGECDGDNLRVFTDFGICFVRNSMSFSSIFNADVIHDDFRCYQNITNLTRQGRQARYFVEDDSMWSPEKGYATDPPINETYPLRAERDLNFIFQPIMAPEEKINICALKNFRVYFHKPNEILTPLHESTYLNFDEYMEFRVFPKSHRTDEALRKIDPDQRKCYFEGERQLKFFKSYTKAHCEWECRANATLKKCGCVKFSMPRDKKTKVCSLSKLQCVFEITSTNCDCHQPCIDLKYHYKVDKTNFNRRLFDKRLPRDWVMSWIQVSIETEVVEEIENFVSYKLQNFISDFGGLLGLFMGCSLLSIIEIFYYLFGGIFSCIFRRKPRKNTPIIQVQSAWANNTLDLKSNRFQVSNSDILYALNALTRTVHEIEMRSIKNNRELRNEMECRMNIIEDKINGKNGKSVNRIEKSKEIRDKIKEKIDKRSSIPTICIKEI